MPRLHALCGVSVIALELALMARTNAAFAQTDQNVLPPVTVEALRPQRAARSP
jgi:iron complex outermembrane recepter protein